MTMSRQWLGMVIFMLAYVVVELWQLFPQREELIHPFPLYRQQAISLQSYIWVAGLYIMQVIFVSVISSVTNHVFFKVAFWLSVIEFVEYLVIYNEGAFELFGVDINITLVRFFILSFMIIKEILHAYYSEK